MLWAETWVGPEPWENRRDFLIASFTPVTTFHIVFSSFMAHLLDLCAQTEISHYLRFPVSSSVPLKLSVEKDEVFISQ